VSRSIRRYDARHGVLQTPEFAELASAALRVCSPGSLALIGGLAVAHYANPPVTVDVDFLVRGTCGDILDAYENHFGPAWKPMTMEFPGEIPKHCVRLRRRGSDDVVLDLIPTDGVEYLDSIVARAVPVQVQPGLYVPIARVEDLIVLKTLANREKDSQDVALIGAKLGAAIDYAYVRRTLEELAG